MLSSAILIFNSMDIKLLAIILAMSFGLFFVPEKFKYRFGLVLHILLISLTSFWAIDVLHNGTVRVTEIGLNLWGQSPQFVIDQLTAFFMLIVNFTCLTGILYAESYLQPYRTKKKSITFSVHYFSFVWLHISMLLVLMLRDGLSFLVAWELMSLSSFLLVIFDAENKAILRTGINYLVQMHVGLVFLLIGFLITSKVTGKMSFDALNEYFAQKPNIGLFLLFFAGFGIKAGFVPLHSWLPEAHPAAPSHVSGVMSGVMIKMGIYGIVRVLTFVQADKLEIGGLIVGISLITGIIGIMFAIVQRDIKKMLAYSSIENIGIIGIGIGLGMIGLHFNSPMLALLGFCGGLLHVLNHSLFKSLLFYSAGAVYKATHTRNIEQLGGLIKRMPRTAMFFLLAALAVCGLPPFNGFISEYLIYVGMFKSLYNATLYQAVTILGTIIGLSLIGGLAVFCFTRVFGVVFLGVARSEKVEKATEVENVMLFPKLIIAIGILIIGLAPALFVSPISQIVGNQFHLNVSTVFDTEILANLNKISLIGGIFIVLTAAMLMVRKVRSRSYTTRYDAPWGCGYTAITSTHQYTGSSYSDHFATLANPLLHVQTNTTPIAEEDIFPQTRSFSTQNEDVIQQNVIEKPVIQLKDLLTKIAFLQTGQIQHYIMYAFVFMLLIFVLSFFNLL